MHELSIALSLVELAQEEAARHGGKVTALHVKVGALSGVVTEALQTSFEIARADTPLAQAQLIIEDVATVVFCPTCGEQRPVDPTLWFICASCGSPTPDVRQGRELQLVALEIDQ